MSLEMTKKCAELMGIEVFEFSNDAGTPPKLWCATRGGTGNQVYDPLTDDAQAMALEDWLIARGYLNYEDGSHLFYTWPLETSEFKFSADFTDKAGRRHAIVECVSKMVKP